MEESQETAEHSAEMSEPLLPSVTDTDSESEAEATSTQDHATADEILSYWEDPKMLEKIIDAKPLESIAEQNLESISEQLSLECLDEKLQDTVSHAIKEKSGLEQPKTYLEGKKIEEFAPPSPSSAKLEEFAPSSPSIPSADETGLKATAGPPLLSTSYAGGNVQLVDKKELKRYPRLCSVGKLFWLHVNTMKQIRWSTAFYVGNSQLVTVRHVFYDEELGEHENDVFWNPNGAVFVPAMIDKYDVYGKQYGCYAVGVHKVHPKWSPQAWRYDICTLTLLHGKKIDPQHYPERDPSSCEDLKALRRLIEQDEIIVEDAYINRIEPIQIFSERRVGFDDTTTRWTVYGYGLRLDYLGSLIDDGKMTKVQGTAVSRRQLMERVTRNTRMELIGMNVAAPCGMSGGPWILFENDNYGANGCQTASSTHSFFEQFMEYMSVSPYFSDDLLHTIGYLTLNTASPM